MRKIKLYSDKKFIVSNYLCHILIPFWGKPNDVSDPDNHRFDKYEIEGKNLFEFVSSFKEADLAIYPSHITHDYKMFEKFQSEAGSTPVVAFFNDDFDGNLIYGDNTYIFRTSFYKSSRKLKEFALSAFTNDYGQMPTKSWTETPTVSFCGQIARPQVREQGLKILENDKRLKTNIIRRDRFWAGWIESGVRDKEMVGKKVRKEYIENISNGDYGLCARGGGNFSYRLYDTMMCGRIPLIIDTDCVFPYDFIFDYGDLFPIVKSNELNSIGNVLLEFHTKIKHNFEEHQNDVRKFWEDYISPCGFFSNLYRHFGFLNEI